MKTKGPEEAPGLSFLHRHFRLDVRMRVVVLQREILVHEVEDGPDLWVEPHRRQWSRLAGQLEPRLFDMVQIEVRIAQSEDEVARREVRCPVPSSL